MSGIRRMFVTVVLTMLAVVAGSATVAPAASAAPPEYKLRWSHAQVADVRTGIARGDDLCDYASIAAGVWAGWVTAGASKVVGAGVGIATGALGLGCGSNDPKLREAVDRAFHRNCGLDLYVTDGPLSYDGTTRYVVCP